MASDGDSEPSAVCRHYAEAGYHFLSITDHMRRVEPSHVDDPHGLLLIPGEELHNQSRDFPEAPLHVNGIGLTQNVGCSPEDTRAQAIQNCIDSILDDGGIAQINHPNWHYAFDHAVMRETQGALLLEVFNGHPAVQNEGDEDHISVERMWDHLLSEGRLVYATAVDDAHHYREFVPRRANPCRGWVWVRVEQLTADEVLAGLMRGDFYASNGVELSDLEVGHGRIRLAARDGDGADHTVLFIGDHGEVLAQSEGPEASFELPAGASQTYVRAKVVSSEGKCAWTQPARVVV